MKHVLRYLKGTTEKELCFKRNNDEKLGLLAYSDADWAAGYHRQAQYHRILYKPQ